MTLAVVLGLMPLVVGVVATVGCKKPSGSATGPQGPASSSGAGGAPAASTPEAEGGPAASASASTSASGLAAEYAWLPDRTVHFNGPYKIAAKAIQAWVHLYPDDETPYLGYLRAGTKVDRSEGWIVKTMRCKEGWYEVLPRGYICDGNRATLNMDDPVVKAYWKPARRGDPLPYRYVRPGDRKTYLYFKLPSKKDQQRTEGGDVDNHVATHPRDRLPNIGVLGEPEPVPEFLANGAELPTPYGATKRLRYNVHEGIANPQAAFALLSTHDHEGRLFGLTTELDLIAIDRAKIVKPSARKGGPVEDLPAGLVRSFGTPRYKIDALGAPVRDGEYDRFHVVDLTGKTHRDLWETRDGGWVTAGSIEMIEPRTSFPSFAKDVRKWLDISIKRQLLVAYVGTRAVYVAQVSTGLGEMSDPEKTFATVRGAFTIKSKHVTATMTGNRQAEDYELADVPYVQYFQEGYALHAAFWHDNFGRTQSHGCVNLTPTDAAWLFEFTDPPVPPEWHGANATEEEPGSVVYVRY